MAYTPTYKTTYKEQIAPALMKEFGYKTVMQVPRLQKIVVNQGMGQAVADKKLIEVAAEELALITGQKVLTLWHLGPYTHRSRVIALGEIGATAFARQYLGLRYSPLLLETLLLYGSNAAMAKDLYKAALAAAAGLSADKVPDAKGGALL